MLPSIGFELINDDIGETEVLTTHPDLSRPIKAFPPAEIQALNLRRAYAVAGGLVGRGFIKADHNDPDHARDWTSLIEAIQEELNSLEFRS